jgi:malate dehydrogenase
MARAKISIIGAGRVGATTALLAAARDLGDLVLVDLDESVTKGIALDLSHAMAAMDTDVSIVGTNDYSAVAGSHLVVITAGAPRKLGQTREELAEFNGRIVRDVARKVHSAAPDALQLIVTNPLDVMTWVALQATGLPREKVFGLSGALDTARMRSFAAQAAQLSVRDVDCMVVGSHGEDMIALPRFCQARGAPLARLLPKERVDAIAERTRRAGAEILALEKTSSAYYGPAAAIVSMAHAILHDEKRVIPSSVYLQGEYGIHGVCLGTPAVLGAKGVEKVLELELTQDEYVLLGKAADALRPLLGRLAPLVREGA